MLYIERPKGADISDREVVLVLRDENGLRSATVTVRASQTLNDEVGVTVATIPGDTAIKTFLKVEQRAS